MSSMNDERRTMNDEGVYRHSKYERSEFFVHRSPFTVLTEQSEVTS